MRQKDKLGRFTKINPITRFWNKVEITNSCWIWMGGKDKDGYGMFSENGNHRAHRFSYELFNGFIPKGMYLDHLCKNHSCVNPAHLDVVTPHENIRRGNTGIHEKNKTHCPQDHEYTESNTIKRRGKRECRTCNNLRSKNRRIRLRGIESVEI